MSITVLFTCHKCGLQRVRVLVPARAKTEDVVAWVQKAADLAGKRHLQLAPTCDAGKLDLAIPEPLNEGDGIGMSAKAVPDQLSSDFMKSKGAN